MPDALRILDANLNRAREALRVMEDYARFTLDDATLSAALKQARHDLRDVFPEPMHEQLIRARDIVSDVGREVTTSAEQSRAGAVDVVIASGKRLSEALRTMEEYAKTVDASVATSLERLRYRAYELERRLTITRSAQNRLGSMRLYVLITESLCAGDWWAVSEKAPRGGADCLQIREKHLPDAELLRRIRRLSKLCHEHGAICIVNDRADLARLGGADGLHIGQDDVSVTDARRVLREDALVGLSTHTPVQVTAAIEAVPDYIAVGPMFQSQTKPQDHVPGPELLRDARLRTALPLVAIGGITPENAPRVLDAGDCCLCVCSEVIASDDPEQACRTFKQALSARATVTTPDK